MRSLPASHAQIFACEKECAALEESLKSFEEILRREFSVTDPGISITVAGKEQGEWEAFTKESTKKAEMLLFMMPNGIQAMSADIKAGTDLAESGHPECGWRSGTGLFRPQLRHERKTDDYRQGMPASGIPGRHL